jgi:glutaryl-CoA dehydrogenase
VSADPRLVSAVFDKFDPEDPMRVETLLTEEEVAIQDTARAFAQEQLAPKVKQMYRDECEL